MANAFYEELFFVFWVFHPKQCTQVTPHNMHSRDVSFCAYNPYISYKYIKLTSKSIFYI